VRRSLLSLSLVALAGVPLAHAAATITPAESKALLRVASTLSRLAVHRPVPVVTEPAARYRFRRLAAHDRLYSRARQAYDEALYSALGLTSGHGALRKALVSSLTRPALYDPQARRLYVPRGRGGRSAVLHELVHALQDQAFDVRRTRALAGNRDARLAATAVIEGHASLVATLLRPRARAIHGGRGLARFLALEHGFPSTSGERFAVTLRNLGGNLAVFGALRRLPETTEQILHVDKFLERERAIPLALPAAAAGLTRSGSDTFGELDVRALLASFAVPRLDRTGAGWGGGRSALYRGGGREAAVVALDWDEELDAVEWDEAVHAYVDSAFDPGTPGPPATTPCTASACWDLPGHALAFERSGRRTALVSATDLATAARLARVILGFPDPLPPLDG
jgi:hypothetical protein